MAKKTLKSVPRSTPKKAPQPTHTCTMCGTAYTKQQSNFPFSSVPMYEANNRYFPVCTNCLEKMLAKYTTQMGSEMEAMRRLCMKMDAYFSPDLFRATDNTPANRSRVVSYCGKLGLRANVGKTFDDTLAEEALAAVGTTTNPTIEEGQEVEISPDTLRRWGAGFSAQEYLEADKLYEAFKTANPKADGVQIEFIHDLVKTKMLMDRAFVKNDADSYTKYTKAYQEMLKSSKLKISTTDEIDANAVENGWGSAVKMVENFTPAYLYKKSKLFEDVDGITDYFKRMFVRPFKNFFTGSNVPDSEYRVLPGEEEEP